MSSFRLTSPIALALLIAALAPASASAARTAPCPGARVTISEQTVKQARLATLCLVNRARARHGLRPLRLDRKLSKAARRHSRDMVRRRYFSHVSPEGGTPARRLSAARWMPRRGGWTMGENIAWGGGRRATPAKIVRMWMHSPPHRANILSPRFREIGVGIALGAPVAAARVQHGGTYTLDFGRRS